MNILWIIQIALDVFLVIVVAYLSRISFAQTKLLQSIVQQVVGIWREVRKGGK